MMFFTYGLIDPRDNRVFYVGQSAHLRDRMCAHSSCDPANPSYSREANLRDVGIRFQFCIFGEFETRHEAMRLERILAPTLPDLWNVGGLLSANLYPITPLDYAMLGRAMSPFPVVMAYSSI